MYVKMRESGTLLTTHQLNQKQKYGKIRQTFAGIKVILCTLAMLTATLLRRINLHELLPPHSLIVDEASQITMSDFLPAMYHLGEHIRRLGFVGDPKQRECHTRSSEPTYQIPYQSRRTAPMRRRVCKASLKLSMHGHASPIRRSFSILHVREWLRVGANVDTP